MILSLLVENPNSTMKLNYLVWWISLYVKIHAPYNVFFRCPSVQYVVSLTPPSLLKKINKISTFLHFLEDSSCSNKCSMKIFDDHGGANSLPRGCHSFHPIRPDFSLTHVLVTSPPPQTGAESFALHHGVVEKPILFSNNTSLFKQPPLSEFSLLHRETVKKCVASLSVLRG